MTKAELLEKLKSKVNGDGYGRLMGKSDIDCLLNVLAEVVKEALCQSDYVSLPGIGVLEVKKRSSRTGRNPRTGEPLEIPACVVPDFKACGALKDAVKNSCKV